MRGWASFCLVVGLLGWGCCEETSLRPPAETGRAWHISPDGSGDFTTIQAAVEGAHSGDTLFIAPGSYAEAVSIAGLALVLIGAGPEEVQLEHHHVSLPGERALTIGPGAAVVISGLAITQHLTACSNGVEIEQAAVVMRDCALLRCGLTSRESALTMTGCTLHRNCDYECDLEIHLVQLFGGSALLTHNIITGGLRYGVYCADEASVSLACNDCWGHAENYVGCPDPTGTEGNIAADPRYADATQDDCRLLPDSPCLNVSGCGRLGAFGPATGE